MKFILSERSNIYNKKKKKLLRKITFSNFTFVLARTIFNNFIIWHLFPSHVQKLIGRKQKL